MINYLKSFAYTSIIILLGTVIITILNYFNILNGIPLKIIEITLPIIGIFIGSYMIGKKSSSKGYIEGIKYGSIWTILLLVLSLIFKGLHITSIIYFILLILTSVLASILGINKKRA